MLKQVPFRKTLRTEMQKKTETMDWENDNVRIWENEWVLSISGELQPNISPPPPPLSPSSLSRHKISRDRVQRPVTQISRILKEPRSSSSSLRKINSLEVKIENRSMTRIRRPKTDFLRDLLVRRSKGSFSIHSTAKTSEIFARKV